MCSRTHDDPKIGATQRRSPAASYLAFLGFARVCAKSDAATFLTAGGVFGSRSSLLASFAILGLVCLVFAT